MYLKEPINKFLNHKEEIFSFINTTDYHYGTWYPQYFVDFIDSVRNEDGICYKYKLNDYRDSYKYYNIEITVTNNVLTKVHCNCNKFKVTNSCHHIAAVLNLYSDEIFEDKEDPDAIFNKLLKRHKFDTSNAIKKEVNLSVQFSVDRSSQNMKVLIGIDKMYSLLNHFSGFYVSYKNQKHPYSFGKNFEYNPDIHYFSKLNERIISVLAQYVDNKYVSDSSILHIIEFLHYNNIPFYVNNHRIENVIEDFPLQSYVKKVDDNFIINFDYENIYPITRDSEYVYFNGNVYFLNSRDRSLLEDIIDNDLGEIKVSKKEFKTFSNGILKLIKNNLEVDDSAANDIIINVLSDTLLYFDILRDKITCKVIFDYKGNKINYFDEVKGFTRDVEKENEVIADLLGYGFIEDNKSFILDELEDMVNLIDNGFDEMANKYRVFTSEKLKAVNVRKKTNVTSTFSIGSDNIFSYSFDLDNISSDELVNIFKNMNAKKKYYRLKNGDILNLEDENLKELEMISDEMNFTDEDIINAKGAIQKYRAIYLDSIKPNRLKYTQTDNMFDNFIKNFYEGRNAQISIPKKDMKILRDYQVTGVKWLYNIHKTGFGGILADEMGLGKTIQSIYYIKQVLLDDKDAKVLIVVPTSLVYNWKHEFELYGRGIKVNILSGTKALREKLLSEDASVYVTSYGMLREDEELYSNKEFNTMFIDEAQSIKNYVAGITKVCKKIKAETKFALTGTPIENSPLELWSIFDYIMPGYLSNIDRFRAKYKIKDFDEQTNLLLDGLNKQIAPFILRRKKMDVTKELPEKLENNIFVELTDDQKKIYAAELEKTKQEVNDIVNSGGKSRLAFLILPLLTKLRQICIDPKIIYPDYNGGSNKIDSLIYVIKENISNGNKILMFTSFKEAMKDVITHLEKEDIPYYTISGEVSAKERMKRVNEFNERSTPAVFLIMLKAGGTGLNLASATTVIHLDLWWNPQAENQATDRAHRIGQTKTVEVIHIICKGTIEEKILELQKKKLKLSEKLIDGQVRDNDILSSLSEKEIRELLSNENKD